MDIIINRKSTFSVVNGILKPTTEAWTKVNAALKEGRATKLIDTSETAAYRISNYNHGKQKEKNRSHH